MQQIIRAAKLFTGTDWLYQQQVIVEDGLVQALEPITENAFIRGEAETFLAPAFVDLQVYGAGGKLFALYPTPDTLQTMFETFAPAGTCLFQPTLATNSLVVFKQAIDAVRQYWQGGGKGVHGLHLEGPWINPEKRGAHVAAFIHPPTEAEVEELLAYGEGVIKTITLAPEVCSKAVLRLIRSHGVLVSAGHSNATCGQATEAFDEDGITAVTHLFNAMSPLHHREPGLVGASLLHAEVRASIIPDGHHVDFRAVALAKQLMGDRLFAITDAVTETTEGPYQHHRVDDKYECNGTLSGSALHMYDCFFNLVTRVGISVEEALRMCSLYPARVLDTAHLYGKIAPGFAAQFVWLDKQLKLAGVVNGSAGEP